MDRVGTISRRCFVASAVTVTIAAALQIRSVAGSRMRNSKNSPEGDAMMTLTPYLLFDGNCGQAMKFYQSCFGGDLTEMQVKDSPAKDSLPSYQHEKILNARLKSRNIDISASDWLRPDRERIRGNTVCLYLSGGTIEELHLLFERLSEGGDVTDPLKEMFFGTYGALNDKFGVRWMFSFQAAALNGKSATTQVNR